MPMHIFHYYSTVDLHMHKRYSYLQFLSILEQSCNMLHQEHLQLYFPILPVHNCSGKQIFQLCSNQYLVLYHALSHNL